MTAVKVRLRVSAELGKQIETALAPVAHEGHQMIDARGLHEWLGSKDYYHQWMKLLIEEYGFTEPNDYCTISCVRSDGKAGRRKISHYLTINVDL